MAQIHHIALGRCKLREDEENHNDFDQKDFLQEVIFKFKLPPKPVPKIDLQEWKDMQKLIQSIDSLYKRIDSSFLTYNADSV